MSMGCGGDIHCVSLEHHEYEGSKGTSHNTVGLAWRRRHPFIVNSDEREGLHWFRSMDNCKVPVWAFKVLILEPLVCTSFI